MWEKNARVCFSSRFPSPGPSQRCAPAGPAGVAASAQSLLQNPWADGATACQLAGALSKPGSRSASGHALCGTVPSSGGPASPSVARPLGTRTRQAVPRAPPAGPLADPEPPRPRGWRRAGHRATVLPQPRASRKYSRGGAGWWHFRRELGRGEARGPPTGAGWRGCAGLCGSPRSPFCLCSASGRPEIPGPYPSVGLREAVPQPAPAPSP